VSSYTDELYSNAETTTSLSLSLLIESILKSFRSFPAVPNDQTPSVDGKVLALRAGLTEMSLCVPDALTTVAVLNVSPED